MQLEGLGVQSLIEPLLEIEYLDEDQPDLKGAQALLMTSANGVRAFIRLSEQREIPLFAVGEATAGAAKEAGFKTVISAAGDVAALAETVISTLEPSGGELLHVAGTRVAGDLGERLSGAGFTYLRAVLYRARTIEAFSDAARRAMESGDIGGVVLYSPRTARTFCRLVRESGLQDAARGMRAFCLSPAVADAAAELAWMAIETALRPDQAALTDAVTAAGNPC